MILLQETMVRVDRGWEVMLNICPDWVVCATNAIGISGGLGVMWNPRHFDLNAFYTCAGILLTGYMKGSSNRIRILNTYALYHGRKSFWNRVANSGILSLTALILAGDLNFTLDPSEIWGTKATEDPLSAFFKGMMDANALIDAIPDTMAPTWKNGRIGGEGISKRIDHFLVSQTVFNNIVEVESYIIPMDISHHIPIALRWKGM